MTLEAALPRGLSREPQQNYRVRALQNVGRCAGCCGAGTSPTPDPNQPGIGPWQTIDKVMSELSSSSQHPEDGVLFKGGDVWNEQFESTVVGPYRAQSSSEAMATGNLF
jgi:hypothetical protein